MSAVLIREKTMDVKGELEKAFFERVGFDFKESTNRGTIIWAFLHGLKVAKGIAEKDDHWKSQEIAKEIDQAIKECSS